MHEFFPEYDELYVISDLHMGGEKTADDNFQIFNRGQRLQGLLNRIADEPASKKVGLVVNGDIFDSLAENVGYAALRLDQALKMMQRLYGDASFKPVWEGLARLAGKENCHLVFVVGNHDIELALPAVQDSIRKRLAQGQEVDQGRICFAAHGEGYACRVAGAHIFCTHGNEMDEWNWVDYNRLGQLANAMNGLRLVDASKWEPNSGTRLVVDVMNIVKRRYPFVDLLKPEGAAIASVLLAIDRDTFRRLDLLDAFPLLRGYVSGRLQERKILGPGQTDISGVSNEVIAEETMHQLLGPRFREAVQRERETGTSEDELLLGAEVAIAENRQPEEMAFDGQGPRTLGWWDDLYGWLRGITPVEGLRRALHDWLEKDPTFDPNEEDSLFEDMLKRAGPEVDFVITGHTHKARSRAFRSGWYFNAGTWIRTLRLTTQILEDSEAFQKTLWPALQAGTMQALDDLLIPGPDGKEVPLLFDRTNAVKISTENNLATGRLLRIEDGAGQGKVRLKTEPETEVFQAN